MDKYIVDIDRERVLNLRKRICDKHCKVINHRFVIGANGVKEVNFYNEKFLLCNDLFSNSKCNENYYNGDEVRYSKSSYDDINYEEIVYPPIVLLIDKIIRGDYSHIEKVLHISPITKLTEKKYISYYLELQKYISVTLIRENIIWDDSEFDYFDGEYHTNNHVLDKQGKKKIRKK